MDPWIKSYNIAMLLRKKNIAPASGSFPILLQVLLQTYIEHLRGKVEDLKEVTVNNHGKGRTYI